MKQLLQGAKTVSPYLLTAALLPGGTLIALGMWLYRNRDRLTSAARNRGMRARVEPF